MLVVGQKRRWTILWVAIVAVLIIVLAFCLGFGVFNASAPQSAVGAVTAITPECAQIGR